MVTSSEQMDFAGRNFLATFPAFCPVLEHPEPLRPVSGYVPVVSAFRTSPQGVGTCLVPPCWPIFLSLF